MKDGYIAETGSIPTAEEMAAINKLSRKTLSPDQVFIFSVVLCDNQIDRDFERFDDDALQKMASLYIGKTGIFDHSMKGRDQVARIFSCTVEKPAGQTTDYNTPYICVKAKAYMPKTEKNKDLMAEIDAGIKKEVSVGCAMDQAICSICGANVRAKPCSHQKGRTYHLKGEDVVCHHILKHPTDAYEWSFVAVPAQRAAGVVKAFAPKASIPTAGYGDAIVKALENNQEFSLSPDERKQFAAWIGQLRKEATAGRTQLVEEVTRLCGLLHPSADYTMMEKLFYGFEFEDLTRTKQYFAQELNKVMPVCPQLQPQSTPQEPKEKAETGFHNFMI